MMRCRASETQTTESKRGACGRIPPARCACQGVAPQLQVAKLPRSQEGHPLQVLRVKMKTKSDGAGVERRRPKWSDEFAGSFCGGSMMSMQQNVFWVRHGASKGSANTKPLA